MNRLAAILEHQHGELDSIKHRQDMVFKKQDIIHSTLAGEVPLSSPITPCPLRTSSITTWSHVPYSSPFALAVHPTGPRHPKELDSPFFESNTPQLVSHHFQRSNCIQHIQALSSYLMHICSLDDVQSYIR